MIFIKTIMGLNFKRMKKIKYISFLGLISFILLASSLSKVMIRNIQFEGHNNIPDGFYEERYNITIIISDEFNNTAQDMVIFSVVNTNDFDEDGMLDSWEIIHNLDPYNASDAEDDPDRDSLTNLEEFLLGSNPWDKDTDNDGLPDNVDLNLNSFFIPTGLLFTIFGSIGIIYAIFKIIKKNKLQNTKIG